MLRGLLVSLGLIASPAAADDPLARKERSIALLEAAGIPTLATLPTRESSSLSHRRKTAEVVDRTIALAIVAVVGETAREDLLINLTAQFDAVGLFTPQEESWMVDITAEEPQDPQFRTNAAWRYEAAHVMLWALQIYPDIGWPDQITDVPRFADTMRDLGKKGLLAKGRLRSQAELLDAADLMYRIHWAVRQAGLDGMEAPAGLNASVVLERRYALEWLIQNVDWDDVPTDT